MNALRILQDDHGRHIRKLRVSILDQCNFRCFYCMPPDASFMPAKQRLTPQEINTIVSSLVNLGVTQIRVTGGEPTLRREFEEIMTLLAKLPIEKLGLTSNGFLLDRYLPLLKDVGCLNINISIDSLSEEKFNKITRSNAFQQVYRTILQAKEMGFHIKLNALLLKGINDDEFSDFIRFSTEHNIEVRFLELMKIGQGCHNQLSHFLSAEEAINSIKSQEELTSENVEFDSTSFNFKTSSGGRIGFIASETKPFCDSCSRLRLTADGTLRACLMSEQGLSLRGIPPDEVKPILERVMAMKPGGRIHHIDQNMYQIGG